jgi:aspartyl-tRNA(Asn)/glutamyl-tRNA(Gln) amidotransferase subunit C
MRSIPRGLFFPKPCVYKDVMSAQKITPEQVRHVAMLARLALPEDRQNRLAAQLESILEYVDKISAVDVSGVEPMAHALPVFNVFREDVVEPSLPLEKVLANAPDTDPPFFKVPKVVGGDEDSAG